MQIIGSSGNCRKGNDLQNWNNLGTMRMLEQLNNLQCECLNNETTYNVFVGTMKQHTMQKLEQWNNLKCECWNNLQCECWNNGTT